MSEFVSDFRRWFWARPRAHGETIEGRRVSNTELLYDLIYVAVIAQSTMALGNNLTVGGVLDFVVVFALTWIGWVNGSLYLELHGREDGRTRSYVFLQMAILCVLAVFYSTRRERHRRAVRVRLRSVPARRRLALLHRPAR
ncbi:MAG TPA: low temperature requirement protein A [Candidatus Limnocylindrales bacterium]